MVEAVLSSSCASTPGIVMHAAVFQGLLCMFPLLCMCRGVDKINLRVSSVEVALSVGPNQIADTHLSDLGPAFSGTVLATCWIEC